MSLLAPAAALFLVLGPLIALLYLLRAQHQRQEVPSLLLWRQIRQDAAGRPRWRWPLRHWLLLLQLLAVALGVLALMRPALLGGPQRHLIVLLDASGSMQATDVLPSRFEEAKRQAAELLRELRPNDEATLVRVGPTVEVVDTGPTRQALLTALGALQPSAGRADVRAALQLAATLAREKGGLVNEVVFFTDGAFGPLPQIDLGAAQLRFVTIGQGVDNQAIVNLQVRRVLDGGARFEGFVRIANFSDAEVEVPVKAIADGAPIDLRRVRIPARGQQELTIPLPQGVRLLEVRLERSDLLAIDNVAQVLIPVDEIEVLLVSAQPTFWERTLRAVPGVRVRTLRPPQYTPQQTAPIVVFDSFLPRTLPTTSLLLINPPPQNGLLEVRGEARDQPVVWTNPRSPLLEAVDLSGVTVPKVPRLTPPRWATPSVQGPEGPIVLEGYLEGQRVVIYAFDARQPLADFPQRLGFPLLVANTLTWLSAATLPPTLSPGSALTLVPLPEAREIAVRDPVGRLFVFPVRGRALTFNQTEAVGRYEVVQRVGTQVVPQPGFVVNAGDELESDIRPHAYAPVAGGAALAGIPRGVERELWPLFATLALVVLGGEWIYYARR